MTFATTTSTTSDHHIHRSICSCKIIWSLSHLQLSRGTGCVDSSPPVRPFYLFSNSFECSSPIPLSIHSCNDSSDRDNGPWPCGIANRQQPILKTRIVWIQCRYIVPVVTTTNGTPMRQPGHGWWWTIILLVLHCNLPTMHDNQGDRVWVQCTSLYVLVRPHNSTPVDDGCLYVP